MKPSALLFTLALGGCHPKDIDPLEEQPKYKAYSENEFFPDHMAMRTPPEGTVAREHDFGDPPTSIDIKLLELGREKYHASCGACHGVLGDGDGVVAGKMGLRAPPSLLSDRVRTMPKEKLYEVITYGYGLMPKYAISLSPRERWATVAYVRALELSQQLPVDGAPADILRELEKVK
jgi:mono/diheme cytochrome c family protein